MKFSDRVREVALFLVWSGDLSRMRNETREKTFACARPQFLFLSSVL